MDTREQIILAAIDEFGVKGLKFTMDDIARRLSISKKTIYTVFTSKEEILDGIADYGFARIKEAEEQIFNSDADIVDKIRNIIIAMPDSYRNLDFRKLEGLKEKFPNIYEKIQRNIETGWENTMTLISQGVSEGRIRQVKLVILKEIISGTIEKFISSSELKKADIEYNEALENMMDIIMGGLIVR